MSTRIKPNSDTARLLDFHARANVKPHPTLKRALVAHGHLVDDTLPAASAALERAETALRRAERDAKIYGDTLYAYDFADAAGDFADFTRPPDGVKAAQADLDEARLDLISVKHAIKLAIQTVSDRAQDPTTKLASKTERVWKSAVHPNLDPDKTSRTDWANAMDRADIMARLCLQVALIYEAPKTRREASQLRDAFEQTPRPIVMPTLAPIRAVERTQDEERRKARSEGAARMQQAAIQMSGDGISGVRPMPVSDADRAAIALTARRRTGHLKDDKVEAGK